MQLFCHAANKDSTIKRMDFASDAKEEKGTARSMMEMTTYLNTHYFNPDHSTKPDTIHEVVCYTCHRGTHEPDAKAFLSLIDSTLKSAQKEVTDEHTLTLERSRIDCEILEKVYTGLIHFLLFSY